MHQRHGRLPVVLAIISVLLWAGAVFVTVLGMRQLPTSPIRSSLVFSDLWLLTAAMTATLSLTVVVSSQRRCKAFFEYGYLSAVADLKPAQTVSISTRGTYHYAERLTPQPSDSDR